MIILAAGCRDGAGNKKFVEYVTKHPSWQAVLEDFPKHRFVIGPHKAYQLAQQARDHYIILVSEIEAKEAVNYMVSPAGNLDEHFNSRCI